MGKEKNLNIVKHSLNRLKISEFDYKAQYYLDSNESAWAKKLIDDLELAQPTIAICTKSKEEVKNWPEDHWHKLVKRLAKSFSIIHLGDDREPHFQNVRRFAGYFTMRESAALLSRANFFVGPDSLLMHVANGLDVPSVIIFGGSRPVSCFGYGQNQNLESTPICSPCWIHEGFDVCTENIKCLNIISVDKVISSLYSLIDKSL